MKDNYQFPEKIVIMTGKGKDSDIYDAALFLKEEIAYRSGVDILMTECGAEECCAIVLKREDSLKKEEFSLIRSEKEITVSASEKRGFLYGTSWILRHMYLKDGKVGFSEGLKDVRILPSYVMRGHQLGYRDKQNTCPAWTEKEYERYIRDLLIFGSNAIEILPPRTDDNLYSCHFKRDPLKMMIQLSQIIHSYGMEVHVWYPYLNSTIEGETFQKEMEERDLIFRKVPYIDGLLIPAGDPGELPPKEMIKAAESTAALLHAYHPEAKVWMAPQSFAPREGWYDDFYEECAKEPEWLYGVCFAPWEKDSIQEMYEKLPGKYKDTIRNYPDITHNIGSQFEVPDWDEAFAYTLGREAYNARPYAFQKIHEYHKGYVMGSITYSEGIHDDVNKMVWGNMDYLEDERVEEAVKDYVRLFIDPDWTEELADIILRLEDSWKGRILENKNIVCLYEEMMALENKIDQKTRKNFRYQLLLLRVLGDYQTQLRYAHDQALEKEVYQIMEDENKSFEEIIEQVQGILRKTYTEPVGVKERFKLQRLSDELYASCKIQLTTTRHKGQFLERGAWLDTLNMALNDSQWINASLNRMKEQPWSEEEKKAAIRCMVKRCDPGKGGQYLNLGSREGFAHVRKNCSFEEDPCFIKSPLMAHSSHLLSIMYQSIGWYDEVPLSVKWAHGARTLYGTPLVVETEGLDPDEKYELMVTYQDMVWNEHYNLKCYAGEELVHTEVNIEDEIEKGTPTFVYDLPEKAYRDGKLMLTWKTYQPEGGCTVCEIWIRPKSRKGAQPPQK